MEQNTKSPTRSTANAHEGQNAADTNPRYAHFLWSDFWCNRKLDIAEGDQVKVPLGISKAAGITCPVFLFRMVYADLIEVETSDQGKAYRLYHLLKAVNLAIANESPEETSVSVSYSMINSPKGIAFKETLELVAEISALDMDDLQPAITVRYIYPDYDPFIYPDDEEE